MLLQPNTTFDNHYTLIRQLGRGGFSEVWLAHDSYMDIDVAIKIYAPGQGMDSNSINEFRREITGVFQLNHPNLLCPKHLGIWENMPYLIMAYCPAGSCLKFVGNISESKIWHLIHDVAAGLAYLHEKDIVHQDIKPDNILIDTEGNYLITDFGISTRARSTLRKSVMSTTNSAGTLAYMGPERFSTQPAPTKASDIWSLGAMLYELLEGVTPFPPDFGGSMLNAGAAIPAINAQVSENLKQTIYKMLSKETWDRPTATTLIQWASNPSGINSKPHRPTQPKVVQPPIKEPQQPKQQTSQTPKYGLWILVVIALCIGLALLVAEFNDNTSSTTTSTQTQVTKQTETVDQNRVKRLITDICACSSRGGNYYQLTNYYTSTISPYVSADKSKQSSDLPNATKKFVENYPEYNISEPYNFQFVNNTFPLTVKCDVDVTWTMKNGAKKQARIQKTYYITLEYKVSGFVDKEIARKTLIQKNSTTNSYHNNHEYVDLGLSVKWATCNIGATSPEDYGDFFAWGETTIKSTYHWNTYKWCNGNYDTPTKYNNNSSYDIVDNKILLDKIDDAAASIWGGNWRMPTFNEYKELYNNCTWNWIIQNGVKGYKVTSKKNGNCIFLPAAGNYHHISGRNSSSHGGVGRYGTYWLSSFSSQNNPNYADNIYFDSTYVHVGGCDNRSFGLSIRPIYPN